MTTRRPSPLAIALLDRFILNEALKGDLIEQSTGRSSAWLWYQITLALLTQVVAHLEITPRRRAEDMLLAAAMLTLVGFNAVVAANLFSRVLFLNDAEWILHSGQYAGWQMYAIAALIAACAGGLLIGIGSRSACESSRSL